MITGPLEGFRRLTVANVVLRAVDPFLKTTTDPEEAFDVAGVDDDSKERWLV